MGLSTKTIALKLQRQTKILEVTDTWFSIVLPRYLSPELSILNLSKVDVVVKSIILNGVLESIDDITSLLAHLLVTQISSIETSDAVDLNSDVINCADDFIPVCLIQPLIGISGISLSVGTVTIKLGKKTAPYIVALRELNLKQRSKLKFRKLQIAEWTRETYIALKSLSAADSATSVPFIEVGPAEYRQSIEVKKQAGQELISQSSKSSLESEVVNLQVGTELIFLLQNAQSWAGLLHTYSLGTYSQGLTFYRECTQDTQRKSPDYSLIMAAAELQDFSRDSSTKSSSDMTRKQLGDFFAVANTFVLTVPQFDLRYTGLKIPCILGLKVTGIRLETATNRLRVDFEKAVFADSISQELGHIEFLRIYLADSGSNPHRKFVLIQV